MPHSQSIRCRKADCQNLPPVSHNLAKLIGICMPHVRFGKSAARQLHHADAERRGVAGQLPRVHRAADYPRDRYEIILADAHSTDRTREIAKKYGAIVLDDDGKNMEEGKRLALQHATGEFIVFVDADNEITHADYIELAVKALAANPQALGVESYYLPSPKMSSFCAYITHLLHISDPIAWLMSANPNSSRATARWNAGFCPAIRFRIRSARTDLSSAARIWNP
jgi:hypothetical protein